MQSYRFIKEDFDRPFPFCSSYRNIHPDWIKHGYFRKTHLMVFFGAWKGAGHTKCLQIMHSTFPDNYCQKSHTNNIPRKQHDEDGAFIAGVFGRFGVCGRLSAESKDKRCTKKHLLQQARRHSKKERTNIRTKNRIDKERR